ncbi:MAG: response regulator [Myxococcales bacterium]|nr:response regulator [Myxococcales bacterium]
MDVAALHGSRAVVPGAGRLVVVRGPQLGRRYAFEKTAVLGRALEATLVIEDAEVSRSHARISYVDGAFVIEDLASRNGTFVNGRRIERAPLAFGDEVRLGTGVTMLFAAYDKLSDRALQRQHFEALGRLAAGISHDFNNMLGAVLTSLDYLRSRPPDQTLGDPGTRECLADVETATSRAAQLASRLLSFSRAGKEAHELVDVSAVCLEIAQILRRTLDRSIRIETHLAEGLALVGDAAELHQIVMNLCLNARDAMPNGGVLAIAAELEPAARAGGNGSVVITVSDTGIGMDEPTRARIFEPFFTTKSASGGFGLGLASVQELLSIHGGKIDVTSKPEAGSSFRVTFPAATARTGQPARPATTAKSRVPTLTGQPDAGRLVLVVDDEEVVRRSIVRILAHAGFDTVGARDGQEALARFGDARRPVDLVILDLDLPEVTGEEALQLMRSRSPDVRVLVLTGHHDPARERAVRDLGAIGFLYKPCGAGELLAAVEDALVACAIEDPSTTGEHTADTGPRGEG